MTVTFTNRRHIPTRVGPPISPGAYFEVIELGVQGVRVRFDDEPGTAEITHHDWFEALVDGAIESVCGTDRVSLTPQGAELVEALA